MHAHKQRNLSSQQYIVYSYQVPRKCTYMYIILYCEICSQILGSTVHVHVRIIHKYI